MYTIIYHNNHPIILCDVISNEIAHYYNTKTILLNDISNSNIQHMLQAAEKNDFYAGIFLCNDFMHAKNQYWKFFNIISASGGVVFNHINEILLIYRRGYWDLPKGKVDKNETLEQCAIREVQEETGLTQLILQEKIITTYHTYKDRDKYILKECHWFKMKVNNNPILTPQIEEQIEIAKWVLKKDIKNFTPQMYPSIRDLLSIYMPY